MLYYFITPFKTAIPVLRGKKKVLLNFLIPSHGEIKIHGYFYVSCKCTVLRDHFL